MPRRIAGFALLAAGLAAAPAAAQLSPATPSTTRPPAATEGATRPRMADPVPDATSGANRPDPGPAAGPLPGPAPAAVPPAPPMPGRAVEGRTASTPAGRAGEGAALPRLEAGANSFTRDQARGRIEEAGYAAVGGLVLDADGIWRGVATRDGRPIRVGVDYRGTVSPMP